MKIVPAIVTLLLASNAANADCSCQCVNGRALAICQSALDIKPICAPQVCSIPPPSVRPIEIPSVPPIGTTQCRQEQVLSPITNRYEWKQICR